MGRLNPQPTLAHDVFVQKKGRTMTIRVDGVEFPFYLARDVCNVQLNPDSSMKRVSLELLFDGDILVDEDSAFRASSADDFEFAPNEDLDD